jgi:hypothetical protein
MIMWRRPFFLFFGLPLFILGLAWLGSQDKTITRHSEYSATTVLGEQVLLYKEFWKENMSLDGSTRRQWFVGLFSGYKLDKFAQKQSTRELKEKSKPLF